MPGSPLRDSHGRACNYLRVSVTDRCNLSCGYCVSGKREQFIPHDNILRYEELLRFLRIGHSLGVRKTRITGGEPFMRLGLMPFLHSVRTELPAMRLCVTTNGTLLEPLIADLARLGLYSINISLDSFDRDTVRQLTGRDCLATVLQNMERLLAKGQRIKINAVALRGISDVQLPDCLHAITQYPVDLRFIEFMPMGANTQWNEEKFLPATELIDRASQLATLKPTGEHDELSGPARMYTVKNAKGRLGFISAVSNHFCGLCNRLRLTSDGRLRTCLFSDREYHLVRPLRHARVGDKAIGQVLKGAMSRKPRGNLLLENRPLNSVASRQMVGIGG